MSHVISDKDYTQQENEKNDSFDTPSNEREGWFVVTHYMEKFGLNFLECGLLCILITLSRKKGYAYPRTDWICSQLGVKKDWVFDRLNLFEKKKIIFRHTTMAGSYGKRRQIVTIPSAALYYSKLLNTGNLTVAEKFKNEFLQHIALIDSSPPEDDPPDSKKKIEIPLKDIKTESNPSSEIQSRNNRHPDNTCRESQLEPCRKSPPANNTTYYKYRTSGVTCKKEDAAFLVELKKELEQVCSKEDAMLGLKWYDIQTKAKKEKMENPIACIINAIKQGYCHEKVAEHDKLMADQEEEKHQKIQELKTKKKELSENEKFAHKIIDEFQKNKGFRPRIAKEFFVIFNDSLEKHRDLETSSPYFELPCGEKHYGAKAAVKVNFNEPSSTFKKEIKKFLLQNSWISKDLRKVG